MSDLLITGFAPWANANSNPSKEVTLSLGGIVLPVNPEAAASELLDICQREETPNLLMLGLDRKRDGINI